MATASEEITAITVKPPKILATSVGCANDAPLVKTDEKHPICDWVEFENIRSIAWPSKSGMVIAMAGIPETSC